MSAAAEKRAALGGTALAASSFLLCLLALDAMLMWGNSGGGFSYLPAGTAPQSGVAWFLPGFPSVQGLSDGSPKLQASWPMLSAAAAAFLGMVFYRGIRRNGWRGFEAMPALLLFAGHAVTLYAVAQGMRALPLMIAAAAIIPCIRRLEAVRDVQAEMNFGLALPLFLVASPQTATLVPALAALGALSDPLARRDGRAFAAMFLVAILPTLIALAGLGALRMAAGGGLDGVLQSWTHSFTPGGDPDWRRAAGAMAVMAPAALIPVLYCFMPDRRKQPYSALATIGLPLYLLAGRTIFAWDIAYWAPAGCFLAAFGAWISVARLKPRLRWLSLILLAAGAGASWTDLPRNLASPSGVSLRSSNRPDGAWYLRPALED